MGESENSVYRVLNRRERIPITVLRELRIGKNKK
jgi:hypothetical protein